jgi:hypothetical protein
MAAQLVNSSAIYAGRRSTITDTRVCRWSLAETRQIQSILFQLVSLKYSKVYAAACNPVIYNAVVIDYLDRSPGLFEGTCPNCL